MAAGLGFKDFVTGEVLTAADVDGYLMQGVWVFANAAARDAAVTSPQEGNFAYLKDTNVTTYYTGSAWANLDTTGMTNPMTTTGDTIYSSSGSTPARLGIGTAGQVLKVNSGATAPEWGTAASGGMTLINTGGTTLTGSSITIGSIPSTYKNLQLVVQNFLPSADDNAIALRFNADTDTRYGYSTTNPLTNESFGETQIAFGPNQDNATSQSLIVMNIFDYANAVTWKIAKSISFTNNATTSTNFNYSERFGVYNQTGAITSILLRPASGTFTSGTAFLYGVS
jgi:hypothetical protein